MTHDTPKAIEPVPVTQADRDRAKSLLGRDDAGPSWWSIDSGNADNDPLVQAFARHRIEATALPTEARADGLARKLARSIRLAKRASPAVPVLLGQGTADRILTALRAGEVEATRPGDGLAELLKEARGYVAHGAMKAVRDNRTEHLLERINLALSTPTRCCEETREAAAKVAEKIGAEDASGLRQRGAGAYMAATAIRSMPLPGTPLNEKED